MKSKKTIALILSLGMLISVASCSSDTSRNGTSEATTKENAISSETEESTISEESESQETTSSTTMVYVPENAIPDVYEEVLSDIDIFIDMADDENFDPSSNTRGAHLGVMEEANALGIDEAHSRICFALSDLNGDGIDELIVGSVIDNESDYSSAAFEAGYSVLEIYTIRDDNAVQLVEAWSRNSWFIRTDGRIVNFGSNGAASAETVLYEIISGELVQIERTYSEFNFDTSLIEFYHQGDMSSESELIGESADDFSLFDNAFNEYTSELAHFEMIPVNSPRV